MGKLEKSQEILSKIIDNDQFDDFLSFAQINSESYDFEKSLSCVLGIDQHKFLGEIEFDNRELFLKRYNDRSFTFAIIKPDAVSGCNVSNIIKDMEKNGFVVSRAKLLKLSKETAEQFYSEHKGKEFFDRLVSYMTSSSCIMLILEKVDYNGEGAFEDLRDLMGPVSDVVDPSGNPNSLRAKYGVNQTENAIHGSDSFESYLREVKFFLQ